jgi:hypothetical protein
MSRAPKNFLGTVRVTDEIPAGFRHLYEAELAKRGLPHALSTVEDAVELAYLAMPKRDLRRPDYARTRARLKALRRKAEGAGA